MPVLITGFVAIVGATVIAFSRAATGPSLYLTPSTGTVAPDATVSINMLEDSGTTTVNAVQAAVGYDKTQLQFVGFTEAGPFNQILSSDTSTAGLIRVARGIPVGATPVSGTNSVVTLKFKVLATSGSPAISFNDADSGIASSTSNANILAATQGATLTVQSSNTSDGRLSVDPSAITAKQGDVITLALDESSSTTLVSSVQMDINYDPAKLQLTALNEGTVFSTILATDQSVPGVIRLARGTPTGSSVSGQNLIARLSFKVLGTTGNTPVTIDQTLSHIGSAVDPIDILGGVSGSTVTISQTPSGQSALLSLSPASGTFTAGQTIPVTINANGGAAALSTAEAVITYPANQLQFVSITDNSTYPTILRSNSATAGRLDIIRGVAGGSAGVSGTNPVTVVNFKVIGTTGTAGLAFVSGSGLYDDTGSGTNILDLANSSGAQYTVQNSTPSPSPSPSPTPTPPPTSCTANPSTPGAPTASTIAYTSLTLTWTASTPGTNCVLGGYHLMRNGVAIANVTSGTTFQDSGLSLNTAYNYSVQAFDNSGHVSAVSPVRAITTKADNQAPTAPTGFTASASTSAGVDLSWTASSDLPNPGGVGVAGYHIFRNGATTPTYTVATGTTFTDSNVTAGTTYTYTVTAFDRLSNESSPSNVVSVKTPAAACSGAPTVPNGLTLTTVDMTSVTFSWSASTASDGCQMVGYKIFRGATLVGTVTDTTFTDNGLQPNTIYAYIVKAYDSSAHTSAGSAPLVVTTPADTLAPNAPANVTAVIPSAGQVTLSWTAASDNVAVTGYRIYRDGTRLTTVSATARTYTDTGLTANTDYRYELTAIDASGNESPRTAANPSPIHTAGSGDAQAPSQPSGLHTLAVTSDTIAFGWNASTDNVGVLGYRIYRGSTLLGVTTVDSFADTGLTPDTAYTYTVKAFDAAGNLSQPSPDLQVSTLGVNTGSLIGDLNGDGRVDVYDLSILLTNWEQQDVPPSKGDLNQDNIVNFVDLVVLLLNYGEGS